MASLTDGQHTSNVSLTSSNSASSSSPANKRRSSFRKWFANPVRKLSQGKLEKGERSPVGEPTTPGSAPSRASKPDRKGAKFSPFKIEAETAATTECKPRDDSCHGDGNQDNEAEEELIELPPPMAELKRDPLQPAQPSQSSSENQSDPSQQVVLTQQIETIVKQRLGSESCQVTDSSSTTTTNSTSDAQSQPRTSTEIDPSAVPSANMAASGASAVAAETKTDDAVNSSAAPETPEATELSEQEAIREKYKKKRAYVLAELIETERDYVRDLGLIVEGYMKMIRDNDKPMPEGMEGKDKIVFGNIHAIYDWHRETFSQEIEKCSNDPARIGILFTRFEKRLDTLYVKYCENKPKSEYIVAEYIEFFEELRREMGHKLQLPDLLIKPVQRITKYQLLLKDILKNTDHMGDDTKELQRAVQVMCVVPKAANDMMNVGRLQGFDGNVTAQGNLLLQETLMVMEMMPKTAKSDQQKFKERRVFLFDQIIIFSEEIEKKKNNLSNPGYTYKRSLMVNKMELDEKGTGELTFAVIDRSRRSDLKLVCQAPSEQVKQNWVAQIKSILKMQKDFLTALTNPTKYNQMGPKDPFK